METNTYRNFSCGSKTFLVGEYAALAAGPALLVVTEPRIELRTEEMNLNSQPINPNQKQNLISYDLHPESFAAKLFANKKFRVHLSKNKIPLNGLGVSTAEYLALWTIKNNLQSQIFTENDLNEYRHYTHLESEIKPSGYDLLVQNQGGVVCVGFQNNHLDTTQYPRWPLKNVGFLLCYTHNKLATHSHLSSFNQSHRLSELSVISSRTVNAFKRHDEDQFVNGVKSFNEKLIEFGLVDKNTETTIKNIIAENKQNILAAKGCGAMGADVICFFSENVEDLKTSIIEKHNNLTPFATHLDITGSMKVDTF